MLRKLLTNSLLFGISPYIPQVINVFLLPIMTQYLIKGCFVLLLLFVMFRYLLTGLLIIF